MRAELLEEAIADLREALSEKSRRIRQTIADVRPDLSTMLAQPRDAKERIIAALITLLDNVASELDEVALVLHAGRGTA
jgi:hypothetical protein